MISFQFPCRSKISLPLPCRFYFPADFFRRHQNFLLQGNFLASGSPGVAMTTTYPSTSCNSKNTVACS